jgi:hypothetical protein
MPDRKITIEFNDKVVRQFLLDSVVGLGRLAHEDDGDTCDL